MTSSRQPVYHGRIAPSPTGYLHLGHARTFWLAHQRARRAGGRLSLRIEDIDGPRCRPEFAEAIVEDLEWLGLDWDGAVVRQSTRYAEYRAALLRLVEAGAVYPCYCSRRDIREAASAPHEGPDEIIYPGRCRPARIEQRGRLDWDTFQSEIHIACDGRLPAWRFRVPSAERIGFTDAVQGVQLFEEGRDFGDFVVWRQDGIVSYQLACVVDDAAQGITEIVRGEDLLVSTARQLLLDRALGLPLPGWFHCPLMRDADGQRLAKRDAATSLRELRSRGEDPARWMDAWQERFGELVAG